MREIKFRAWDEDKNIMYYDVQGAYDNSTKNSIRADCFSDVLDNYQTMQYTGLKDKITDIVNEVYEHDILEDKENMLWLVEWDYKNTGWCVIQIGTSFKRKLIDLLLEGSIVIGNKYENKDLLS